MVERCLDEITQLEEVVGDVHERPDAMERHVAQIPPGRLPPNM